MEIQRLFYLTFAVLGFPSLCMTRLTPRVFFPLGSQGRRLINFSMPDVSNTTTLLLSKDGEMLYVGAENAVLALDVSHKNAVILKNKLHWSPSERDLEQCSIKGKKMADCSNFIRVLQFFNATHIYACGTFAFSPRCTYINIKTFTMSLKLDEGRGRCPYDPYQRNTAIIVVVGLMSSEDKSAYREEQLVTWCTTHNRKLNLENIQIEMILDFRRARATHHVPLIISGASMMRAQDGELYTGTVADYRGNRPVISRHLIEGNHADMKLDDSLGWLEDPTFIGSSFIPDEQKIFFFFHEVGTEFDFIDKFIVSRVSQICRSDVGGQRTLQRRWTTFAKALLLCQADDELPYNVIQDIETLLPAEGVHSSADDTLFYGIFHSQWSVNSGRSAVCSFRLADIKSVFSGNYKALNRDTLKWSTRAQEMVAKPGECGLHNASDNALHFVKENFLADDSVRPIGRSLCMVSAEHKYSHLTVQRVHTANNRNYTVLFLLTDSGYIHKAVLLESGAHIIEEVQVLKQAQPIKSLTLSIPKGMIYVGTPEGVVKVPTANCSFYWTCPQCILARDPFCGWDPASRSCVGASNTAISLCQDVDRGNVEEACNSLTLRARYGPNKIPAGELVSVSLNEVVKLQCPTVSRLSEQQWQRPNSRLSPDLYLHMDDGSLNFVATPTTLGHYLCLSTENGYQQTMAIYQVKQKSSPFSQTSTTYTLPETHITPTTEALAKPGTVQHTSVRTWPMKTGTKQEKTEPTLPSRGSRVNPRQLGRNFTLLTKNNNLQSQKGEACYLKELVIMSVLLVLCLVFLVTMLLYIITQMWNNRTAPKVETLSRDRSSPIEQEASRVNQFPNKNREKALHSRQACGFVCNGALTNCKGPNTPI